MKNIAAVVSLLGLGLAASVNATSSAVESDGVRVYASYASPHAPTMIAMATQERQAAVVPVVSGEVTPAQVSTDEYVSAHLLAMGQYRGEDSVGSRPANREEKG